MIEFREFYRAVHHRDPFPWQERLALRVAAEGWPWEWTLKLPTASGKTSVLDVAVFALALQAGRPLEERSAPLRTFFVVDRRLVVDDAVLHAQKLAKALTGECSGVLNEIKNRLLRYGTASPLKIAALRGGMYRSDTWVDMPNQPLLCLSTVDQVGSRLLFRGYGTGHRRRAVDAGLVGCDSLIILDEAHISQPFYETLRAVQHYSSWAERQFPTIRIARMSATVQGDSEFELNEDDYKDGRLTTRLNAKKKVQLREVMNLEAEATAAATRLANKEGVNVVGVVLNTVNAARAVFERLNVDPGSKILLTGRIRPYDRDNLLRQFLQRMKAGRERASDRRLFVVATQTIEVGADLDFDALVTEAAALDALRQRFGRLDRLGALQQTDGMILRRKPSKGRVDPVYGEAAAQTWSWLDSHAQIEGESKWIDFGALSMQALFEQDAATGLNMDGGHAPVLTPAVIETWVQTYPAPAADPDVAPFLHGLNATSADVDFVWRADLEGISVGDWRDELSIAPPITSEALPVPIWAAKAWLDKQQPERATDLERIEVEPEAKKPESSGASIREFLIWRGPDDSRPGSLFAIRPGDTLIVRSSEGGADKFGWNSNSTAEVRDVGTECAIARADQAGGRYVIRMHPALLDPDNPEEQAALLADLKLLRSGGDDDAEERLLDRARKFARRGQGWKLQSSSSGRIYATTRWLKPSEAALNGDLPIDETDEDDSSSLTVRIRLEEHVAGVVDHARSFARGCGLSDNFVGALTQAAEWHDLGKWDERFQIMLDPSGESGFTLGKGDGESSRAEFERRRKLAGYPRGARHEFWSVALVGKTAGAENAELRDLLLFLIGTHHGHGRPFAPVWDEEEGFVVSAENGSFTASSADITEIWKLGSGWVDQFWRVNKLYGYWGCAYLEAIFRRADCVESREEQERKSELD